MAKKYNDKGMSQPGKAIGMHHGSSWTAPAPYKGVTGKARARKTMMNRRPQGTGHAGKAGKHITIPKVDKSGYYPL